MTPARVIHGVDRWCVIKGDCVQALTHATQSSVDVCISDPPYSEHTHSNNVEDATLVKKDFGFSHLTDATRAMVAGSLTRVVKRWILLFSDLESVHLWGQNLTTGGARHMRTGIWHKRTARPQLSGDRPGSSCEGIQISYNSIKRPQWNGKGSAGFWETNVNESAELRFHPTQKPLELMLMLVSQFSNRDEIILDPFSGSGTTGVAAIMLGRRYIGIEQDGEFCRQSIQRLQGAQRGLKLEDIQSGQKGLFDEHT